MKSVNIIEAGVPAITPIVYSAPKKHLESRDARGMCNRLHPASRPVFLPHPDFMMVRVAEDETNGRRPLQLCRVRPLTVPIGRSSTHAEPDPLFSKGLLAVGASEGNRDGTTVAADTGAAPFLGLDVVWGKVGEDEIEVHPAVRERAERPGKVAVAFFETFLAAESVEGIQCPRQVSVRVIG